MKLSEELRKKLGDTEPIKGFHVMEWLRGVRDANYELSIKDPEGYRIKRETARKRLQARITRAKRASKLKNIVEKK
jgi:hypothetical protein